MLSVVPINNFLNFLFFSSILNDIKATRRLYMLEIKDKVLSLLKDYVCAKCENIDEWQKKKRECVDKLFILLYYHPRSFGINVSKDVASDFLSQLYPTFIEKLFDRYDETKSNFYTFVSVCMKYQMNFFLQKKLNKTMDESALLQQIQIQQLQGGGVQEEVSLIPEFSQKLEDFKNYKKAEYESDEEMKVQLQNWISDKKMSTKEKYKKRAVFILLCKTVSLVDDEMIQLINNYLEMPNLLLYYYIERFHNEFLNCNKKVENAEYRQNKYFIRYLHAAHLLEMDGKTEYEKKVLEKRLNFSFKHYVSASSFIKDKLKSVSNRTIAEITGFSRSCVDRVCLSARDLLEDIKI